MNTVLKLHELIIAFLAFAGKTIKVGGDEIHLRIFLPSSAWHDLMTNFDTVIPKKNKPVWYIEDNFFKADYRYVNVLVWIEEGKDYRIDHVQGTQDVEKSYREDGPVLPGRAPFVDHRKPIYS